MTTTTAQEQLTNLDKLLEAYETTHHLKPNNINPEADEYMNLSSTDLRKMTAEECGEAAYLLAQRAFYVQQQLNAEISHANWAEMAIRRTIAKTCPNFKAYSYEERRDQAVADNEHAQKLERIRIVAQARVDRLSYLGGKLSDMMRTLLDLQQSKRRDRYAT